MIMGVLGGEIAVLFGVIASGVCALKKTRSALKVAEKEAKAEKTRADFQCERAKRLSDAVEKINENRSVADEKINDLRSGDVVSNALDVLQNK